MKRIHSRFQLNWSIGNFIGNSAAMWKREAHSRRSLLSTAPGSLLTMAWALYIAAPGALDAARASFETVLGHSPQHEGSLLQLGGLAELAGDGAAALKYANVSLTFRPTSVNALILRGVRLANGSTQDALVDLQQVLRLAPAHPRAESI